LRLLATCFIIFFCGITFSQNGNKVTNPPSFLVKYSDEKIVLDGQLDESVWMQAEKATNFSQWNPNDEIDALGETEIFMCYDQDFLYVAAKCYTSGPDFLVQSLKRDYGFRATDNISFLFDTFHDKTNAILFGMNAYGARREALISGGGKSNEFFDESWDNKWDGESKQYDNYWICEMAIPFKILRFQEGEQHWRFNAYRNDTQQNEITLWMDTPREYILMDLQYMGDMHFEKPLDKPNKNISIIPYGISTITRDFEDSDQLEPVTKFNTGLDAKISLGSSLNLDLTANPDFSQVDVDAQVTNLDRFELFFPERRQFFLENADLFGKFGGGRVNPFFSRRIGVSTDTITGNNVQNTIYGGARISGKLNEKLRIGIMSMQAASQIENDLPSYNYSIAAFEQTTKGRSSIAGMLVNKQAINPENFSNTNSSFDRVAALEHRYKSDDNKWTGKTSFMQAFSPDESEGFEFSQMAQFEYNVRKYRLELAQVLVGNGFKAETGFVPRRDILLLSPEFDIRFFPKSEKIVRHVLAFDSRIFYKIGHDDSDIITDFGVEEMGINLGWNTNFTSGAGINVNYDIGQLTLLNDFDPTRIQDEAVFLSAGSKFTNSFMSIGFSADQRKKIHYSIRPFYSQFYGGNRYGFNSSLRYRYLPYGSVRLVVNYNHIDLPDPFETADLWLIGPSIDITFSRSHFFSTFVQYNSQLANISINSRYQWRFAPASDLFIVYTDNYNSIDFNALTSRNRGIVAKLVYWFNV